VIWSGSTRNKDVINVSTDNARYVGIGNFTTKTSNDVQVVYAFRVIDMN